MSQERVARLEGLLARVQENRHKPRIAAAKPEIPRAVAVEPPKPAPAPAAAAEPVRPAAVEPSRAFGRPPVQQPAAAAPRSVSPPAAPPKPAVQPAAVRPPVAAQPPAARPPAPAPEAPAARKPGQDRSATPLEMAVAELDLAGAAKQQPPFKEPPKHVETTPGQFAPTTPVPMIAPDEELEAEAGTIESRVIEPEPIREPARPIAQVVSRHSPQVDATFGAMLKRSLSLRPH